MKQVLRAGVLLLCASWTASGQGGQGGQEGPPGPADVAREVRRLSDGDLSAREAARETLAGWRRAWPEETLRLLPDPEENPDAEAQGILELLREPVTQAPKRTQTDKILMITRLMKEKGAGSGKAPSEVVACLDDEGWGVRWTAVKAIRFFEAREAAPDVLRMLTERVNEPPPRQPIDLGGRFLQQPYLLDRIEAGCLLLRWGIRLEPPLLKSLLRKAEKDERDLIRVIQGMGWSGDREHLAYLGPFLWAEAGEIRKVAARAMGTLLGQAWYPDDRKEMKQGEAQIWARKQDDAGLEAARAWWETHKKDCGQKRSEGGIRR